MMRRNIPWIVFIPILVVLITADPLWARGFGGGGFRGGGGGFRGGGGGFRGAGGMNQGGFSGGGFHGGGSGMRGGSSNWSGRGMSGSGYRPASRPAVTNQSNRSRPVNRNAGNNTQVSRPNVVHRPQTDAPGLNIGSRPQLRTAEPGRLNRPLENRPESRPGGEGRRGLPAGAGRQPGDSIRADGQRASLPGLATPRTNLGAGNGQRINENRATLPGLSSAQSTLNDRGTISERHQDLTNRFNELQDNWNDSRWHHQQWDGPNGGEFNHFGYWGPNGYWGHSGAWGSQGGHWGHTGHVGPEGAWGHTGYFGPAGHWSRNWGWYNGYSPSWGHGRWDYLWDEYPVAMGFGATMWGLNAVNWAFGVSSYYNPYYDSPVDVGGQAVTTYSEPIVGDPAYTSYDASNEAPSDATPVDDSQVDGSQTDNSPPDSNEQTEETLTESDPLTEAFDAARQAFYDEQFEQALDLTNQALAIAPRDAAINEFRSLCLFALGNYRESAATIHAVLAAGPGWDWTTLISLYKDTNTYTEQYRKLEAAVADKPDSADLRFLLGYHYLTGNHQESAIAQWKKVVALEPDDSLTAQLVKMYEPSQTATSDADSTPPPDLEQPAYPIEKLRGTWHAEDHTAEYTLQLSDDDSFTWTFSQNGTPETVAGAYAIRGNNLVMQPDSGGTMLSTITLEDDSTQDGPTLKFEPIGDALTLTFTHQET